MSEIFRKALVQGLKEIDFPFQEKQVELCTQYQKSLISWNQKFNLTNIINPEDVAVKHFIDSVIVLKLAKIDNNANIIDIGTGAGFPGLPLKIFSKKLKITLLDSLEKRCHFLKNIIQELEINNITVVHGRAEDKGRDLNFREKYDSAIARAVTYLPSLVEYCLPFVRIGGIFIALKGAEIDEELEKGKNAINLLGGKIHQIINYSLPITGDKRSLIIIKKIKSTLEKYPRKAGIPKKKPL
ncbi:MAG: 16S rRNA (guanine(527)-N(7))-methyltransferase RsmG [Bacillota bacterium]|jgi:16S rRNA (guanine527-N7)-methyltransferase